MIEPLFKNYSQNFVQSSNKYNILISNEPKILLVFSDIFQKFELLIDELRKKEGHPIPLRSFWPPLSLTSCSVLRIYSKEFVLFVILFKLLQYICTIRYTFFRQITTFIKVHVAFVFRLQTF